MRYPLSPLPFNNTKKNNPRGSWAPNKTMGRVSQPDFDESRVEIVQRQVTPSHLPSGMCHATQLRDQHQRECEMTNLYDYTTYDFQIREHCVKTYLNSPLYTLDWASLVTEESTARVPTLPVPAPKLSFAVPPGNIKKPASVMVLCYDAWLQVNYDFKVDGSVYPYPEAMHPHALTTTTTPPPPGASTTTTPLPGGSTNTTTPTAPVVPAPAPAAAPVVPAPAPRRAVLAEDEEVVVAEGSFFVDASSKGHGQTLCCNKVKVC